MRMKDPSTITVGEVMTKKVITVNEDDSFEKITKIFKEIKVNAFPVLNRHNKLVGIVSESDVMKVVEKRYLSKHEMFGTIGSRAKILSPRKVKDVMTRNPVTISPLATLEQAIILMLIHHVRGLPVINEKNEVIGIIVKRDIVNTLLSESE
ncbi:MAG: HPP family protein [Candidatus Hydrothermarchaeota archaeon]